MTRKEIILLVTLACINFTNIMDFMIMMPLQEFLEKSFGITPRQFGLLVSAYAFSAFAASMTASFLADRFDRKHVLLFAFAGLILGTFGCGMAASYEMLLGSRIVAGLFGGLIAAQALSIVGDAFPYQKRGRAMGLLMGGFAAASIAGVPAGLYFATRSNWQMPFVAIGFLGIAVFTVSLFVIPGMRSHIHHAQQQPRFGVYRSVFSDANRQRALLMMFTLIFSHFATIPFIAPYLTGNTGFRQEQLPLMYFFGGSASLIFNPLIGRIADRYGKHRVFGVFLWLSLLPVFLLTHLGHVPVYVVLIISTLFFIVAGGRMVPAQAIITSVVPPQMRGSFMNLNSSLQQLALGLTAFIGGIIITKRPDGTMGNYQWVGYMSMAVSILCFFVMRKVKVISIQPPLKPENPA